MSRDMYDYWTPTNRDATMPGMNASNLPYENYSDKNLRDASYVRLRYLSVGYNFKKSDLNFMKLSGLRVYAQAENYILGLSGKDGMLKVTEVQINLNIQRQRLFHLEWKFNFN